MNKPKHILIFTSRFAKHMEDFNPVPYLQMFVLHLKWYPEPAAYKVTVVSMHAPEAAETYNWRRATVHAMGGKGKAGGTGSKEQFWQKVRDKFSAVHAEAPVDVIHSLGMGECTWLAQQMADAYLIPLVVTANGKDARRGNPYFKKIDPQRLKLVAVSEAAASQLQRRFPCHPEVIPWGLSGHDMHGAAVWEPRMASLRRVDIIGVGDFTAANNWPLFLETLRILQKQGVAFRAVIFGKGRLRKSIEAANPFPSGGSRIVRTPDGQRRTEGHSLSIMDEFVRHKLMDFFRGSKVLLCTADYTGQNYVFLEALAYGTRIVSTPVGMAPEASLLPQAQGQWALGRTAEELAERVREFMNKPVNMMGLNLYPLNDTVQDYLRLYGI